MRYGIIVDLDDTLISTSPVYYRIFFKVASRLQKNMMPWYVTPARMLEIYALCASGEIPECVTEYFAGKPMSLEANPDDFGRKLVSMYITAMYEVGKVPEQEVLDWVMECAAEIYTAKYHILPGSKQFLYSIGRRRSCDIFLVTHGTEELQRRKIDALGTSSRWVREAHIVPMTTSKREMFEELRERHPEIDEWIVVGDSIKRDINPALAAGMSGFHVTSMADPRENERIVWLAPGDERYKEFYDMNQVRRYMREVLGADEI